VAARHNSSGGKLGRLAARVRPVNAGRIGDYLFVAPALVFILAVLVYPLGYNVYMSLHAVTVGNFLAGTAPFAGLENYREVLGRQDFHHSFWITLIFTVSCLFFQFTIGLALALFFSQRFPANGVLRAFLLLAWMLPLVVTGSLFRWMLDGQYGVINLLLNLGPLEAGRFWLAEPNTALIGVIIANVWVGIPFNMILLLAGLQGISATLYEAAKVDGANALQRFLHITIPQLRPVMLIVLLLGFIYTFKVFDLIFVMTAGGPVNATRVLPLYVYDVIFQFFNFGTGAAAAMLVFVLPLVLALAYLYAIRREEAA
jgi:multiple sugar transport system permease protein